VSAETEALRDEIALRRASIDDARAEFDAGELSGAELSAVVAREEAAIEVAQKRLAESDAAAPDVVEGADADAGQPPRRPARRHRRAYLITAVVSFALAAAVAIVLVVQPRQPGSSDTGSVSATVRQQVVRLLSQAEIDEALGRSSSALEAFNQALALDPRNVEALTQAGWLTFSAGSAAKDVAVVRRGEDLLARAVVLAPRDPAPRMYYAIAAASIPGSRAMATAQFRIFLTLRPSAQLLALARPWLLELKLARQ
jgi:tetratricopeptide (TPR) repeat protein